MLTNLDQAVRGSGLRVIELSGWKTRKSNGGEAYDGVLVHHTGSFDGLFDAASDFQYALQMATEGRPDLPPPLDNLALSAEGTVYISAAGNANHAGEAKAVGPMPHASDGSRLYVGIEAMNSGTQGWKSLCLTESGELITYYTAYVRLVASICKFYHWPASHVRAHWETSVTGKWDPGDPDGVLHNGQRVMDMDKFRAAVDAEMNRKEDDMPAPKDWDAQDWKAIRENVSDGLLDQPINDSPKGQEEFKDVTVRSLLKTLFRRSK